MIEPTQKEIQKALTGIPREHKLTAEVALNILIELAPLVEKMEKGKTS